jgi:hypothetical protein
MKINSDIASLRIICKAFKPIPSDSQPVRNSVRYNKYVVLIDPKWWIVRHRMIDIVALGLPRFAALADEPGVNTGHGCLRVFPSKLLTGFSKTLCSSFRAGSCS